MVLTEPPSAEGEADVTRRRHALLVDVTQAASEVSRLVHEARDLHLPVEPGAREGRDALVRWASYSKRSFHKQAANR